MTSTIRRWLTLVAAFALCAPEAARLQAQTTARSLTDREIESSETKTALHALIRENAETERKLRQAEASVAALQKNLAAASAETEVFKRLVSELQVRLEALGLDAAGDPGKLEQRLLKAVNDLRLSEQERIALRDALLALDEATRRFQRASATEDVEARKALEVALRSAGRALVVAGEAIDAAPVPATLTDAMVISVKDELALVVANVGRRHGVRVGMPFRVFRGETEIGTVRVVDSREKIAGAVVQDLRSETERIQFGDRLKVGADQ
jgi:hypothetical protein